MSRLTLPYLKTKDYPLYLLVQTLPVQMRDTILDLINLSDELEQILYTVSEPMLRAIRYQWWRETFARVEQGEKSGHELDDFLKKLVQIEGAENIFDDWLMAHEKLSNGDAYLAKQDYQHWQSEYFGSFFQLVCLLLSGKTQKKMNENELVEIYSQLKGAVFAEQKGHIFETVSKDVALNYNLQDIKEKLCKGKTIAPPQRQLLAEAFIKAEQFIMTDKDSRPKRAQSPIKTYVKFQWLLSKLS